MVDDPRDSNSEDTGVPGWVYVLGIIAIALLVLVVILHFIFGGPMGHALQQP